MSNSNRVLPVATLAMGLGAAVGAWALEARAPLPPPPTPTASASADASSPRSSMSPSFSGFFRSIFGAADAASPADAAPAVRTVDVATLRADLARGAVPLLVDVRTPGEYGGGHVPGAKNIPLDQLGARMGELGAPEGEVYVICQSGARSARASAQMAAKGLRPVNVAGGTGGWRAAGYPVE